MKALIFQVKVKKLAEIAEATGDHYACASTLILKYHRNGMESIAKIGAMREGEILDSFKMQEEKGKFVDVHVISEAYQRVVRHKVGENNATGYWPAWVSKSDA